MSVLRRALFILLVTTLYSCGIFYEQDENVLLIARQLLQAQVDELGEPRKVDLPVRVNYTVHRKPLIDHDLEIEFEFIAERQIPMLRFGLEASEGLELVSYDIRERYLDVPARYVLNKKVIVVPTEENEFYLSLYVVTEIGDDKRARQIKIPIALGEYSQYRKPQL